MHPYIPHLITDIQNAFRAPKKKRSEEVSFEEKIREVENYVHRPLGFHTFGGFCGLKREDFPPSDQLTDADMLLVIEQFKALLKTWHAEVGLPEEMPVLRQYNLFVEILDYDFMYIEHGFYGIDFCTGDPEGCELGEYCPCLKYMEEEY